MPTAIRRPGLDAAVVTLLAAVMVVGSPLVPRDGTAPQAQLDALGAALLVGSCAVLLLRHRWPVTVLAATVTGVLAYTLLQYPGYFFPVPMVWALYAAARHGRHLSSVAAAIAVPPLILAASLRFSDDPAIVLDGPIWLSGWMVAAIVGGEIVRRRSAYLEALEARTAAAEQALEETARRRAGEERLRIARELHDSLTHTLSVMNVQAGVAAHLMDKRPGRDEETYQALSTVKTASHEALRELRATLGVLRTPGEQPAPPPSLRRLPELVQGARDSGSRVESTVRGPERSLPAEVDRAAYRVVQEALTNVARHAPGAAATVRVTYRDEAVVVDVEDDGSPDAPAPPPGAGHGLVGMRERVAAAGGDLRAGPRDPAGFAVRAVLPVDLGIPVSARPEGLDQG